MGYSIYVVCRSEKAQQTMRKFLKKNLTPWHRLAAGSSNLPQYAPEYDYTGHITAGKNIYCCDHKLGLGWNYGTQGDSGGYLWALLRFIALRVGREKLVDGAKTKYIVYDGDEYYPVDACDANGYRDGGNKFLLDQHAIADADALVKAEMARLGKLWDEYKT